MDKEKLLKILEDQLQSNKVAYNGWIERLTESENPNYEMRWSRDLFAVAANITVLTREVHILKETVASWEEYVEMLKDRVLKDASRFPSSSSETAVLAERYENQALAQVYETLNRGF